MQYRNMAIWKLNSLSIPPTKKGRTPNAFSLFTNIYYSYNNMLTGFSKNPFNVCKNAAPEAPSTTR